MSNSKIHRLGDLQLRIMKVLWTSGDATVAAVYPDRVCVPGRVAPGEGLWNPDPGHLTRYLARDLASEQAGVVEERHQLAI